MTTARSLTPVDPPRDRPVGGCADPSAASEAASEAAAARALQRAILRQQAGLLARQERALAAAGMGLWSCRLRDGALDWSGGVHDLFGVPRGAALHRPRILDLYEPTSRRLLEALRHRAIAGSGAAGGLAVGYYEWSACYVLMLLGWLFVPHYLAYDIYTVPEYLERRFGKNFRTFFTWLSIAATLLTKISVTIFAGAVVMRDVLGWNMWVSSVVLLTLTCAYTSIGGLAAVVYTEAPRSLR